VKKTVVSGQLSVVSHPSDEDLSLHPNEQKSLVGDPESPGPPAGTSHASPLNYILLGAFRPRALSPHPASGEAWGPTLHEKRS